LRGDSVAQGWRRDAIVSAERDEFARQGFAGARIERIAAAAGVNKQLLFHYFHSKEGLYSAAVAASFAEWQPVPEGGVASPSERLRQSIAHLVRWLRDNPGAAGAIADADRARSHGTDGAIPPTEADTWLANATSAVRTTVEGGQRQGYFRDDVDPVAVAEIVATCAVGHALALGPRGDTPRTDSERLATNLSQAMVEYCGWR
jgi:TetR/AcrR family transcriptional regulator